MAFYINKASILGYLTMKPKLRFTNAGTPVTNFVVVTNHKYKSGGEWMEEATFHRVVVWGGFAKWVANNIEKGFKVFVDGRIQKREYEKGGHKRRSVEIVADNVIPMVENKEEKKANGEVDEDVEEIFMDESKEKVKSEDIPF